MNTSQSTLTQEDRRYWAACAGIDGLGRKAFERILLFKHLRELSWTETWSAVSSHVPELYLTTKQGESVDVFNQHSTPASYFDWLIEQDIQVLTSEDKEYSFLLKQTAGKPYVLFTKGEWKWGKIPIAVVGTRKATGYGKMVTDKITKELVSAGASIISGFMYGVDTLAHQTALDNGGHTVGVLGYGFDHSFPRGHRRLLEDYLARGMTFVTEFPPHVPAYGGNFPVRNRIVAGLSYATIVTEAAAESGSLITARLALDYDRLVCAVPGAITHPYSEGTKHLVNQGAKLISSGYEVLEDLKAQLGETTLTIPQGTSDSKACELANAVQEVLYGYLSTQPYTIDDLSQELEVSVPDITVELSLMELEGIVAREGESWRVT